MDPVVLRALAKWPEVPDVYGWLGLDRRGEWRIKGEKIANEALRAFICRNYAPDARGCWYFQNGPQKVFVQLAYTPLVARLESGALVDHCGRAFGEPSAMWLDEEGSLLLEAGAGIALLDDRDLAAYSELRGAKLAQLPSLPRAEVAGRFGFVAEPLPQG